MTRLAQRPSLILAAILLMSGCADRGTEPAPPPVPAVISGVFPESLSVAGVAHVRGLGFGVYDAGSKVVFSPDIPAVVYLSWEDDEIRCIVPEGVVSGPVRVKKGDVTSSGHTIVVAGTQSAHLTLSPATVSLNAGQSLSVSISGGTAPYSVQTNPNSTMATTSVNGSTLTVTGVAQGTTTAVIADASTPNPLTATVTIQVAAQQSGVSFSQQIIPVFSANCVSCHGGTANLYLTSAQAYNSLVNVPAQTGSCAGIMRVNPGNSSQSALYRRVSGTCSERMPLGGSLSQSEIDLIRQWIDQGAHNN